MKKEIREEIKKLPTVKERAEAYMKHLNSMSNKELLCSLESNHKPIYTEKDITPENEKWIRVLMKADKIFARLEKKEKI